MKVITGARPRRRRLYVVVVSSLVFNHLNNSRTCVFISGSWARWITPMASSAAPPRAARIGCAHQGHAVHGYDARRVIAIYRIPRLHSCVAVFTCVVFLYLNLYLTLTVR